MPSSIVPPGACALLAIGVLTLTAPASASPQDDTAMLGGVFTGPAHPHPSAVFVNPAALDLATAGSHFYLSGYVGLDRTVIQRGVITDPDVGVVAGPTVKRWLANPSGLFAFHQKLEQLSIGVTIAVPMVERFINSDELRYHASAGHYMQIAPVSLAVALRPASRLHVGVGLSLVVSSFEMTFARDTALESGTSGINQTTCNGRCGIENPRAAQTIKVDVATDGLQPFGVLNSFDLIAQTNTTLNVGLVLRLIDGWYAGLSYRSAPNFFSDVVLPGTATVTDAPRDGGATHRGKAEVSFRPPQSVLLGLRGGPLLGRYNAVLGVEFHNLSRQNQLDIRLFGEELAAAGVPEWIPRFRGFNDVWRISAGLESITPGSLRYGARVRYETAAVDTDLVTPIQVAGSNLGFAAGAELRFGGGWSLGGSYTFTWYPTMNAMNNSFDPRDRLACVDSGYALTSCDDTRAGRALPTAAGDYSRLVQGFTAWIRYDTL